MPITLNHSNIAVQYSSDKSYIIETVKSDLYRRNEIVETIVRDNIQVAPVTPTTYVDSGNVYAVESYTYSGSANTADFTRVFTKSTTCDILVVGGGGAGGNFGGGGGGGDVIYMTTSLPIGTYSISVGAGGTRNEGTHLSGNNGNNSSISGSGISTIAAAGGGGGAGHQQNARVAPSIGTSSGGGGGGSGGFQTGAVSQYSGAGGNGTTELTPGGGGGGSVGAGGTSTIKSKAGNGGIGNDISITGTSQQYGGGGGGGNWAGEFTQIAPNIGGGTGVYGGGNGAYTSASVGFVGTPGTPNTGGGGGGGGGVYAIGYPGGSGIVIIRYLLGTIPATNYLTNEPVVIAPAFTETIRSFTHSGGTEAQTTHTITVGQNTICDILIVGGGGGGGARHAGGGGAGAVIYSTNITLTAGTYTIGVGKGGNGAVGGVVAGQGNRGEDSRITFNSTNIYLAKGGGAGYHDVATGNSNRDGGSGGGGGAVAGLAVSTNIPSGTYGNSGGILSTGEVYQYAGGGGGGSGTAGSNGTIVNGFGRGGNGGNGTQISITGTNVYYGGGGGGGTYTNANNIAGTGGLGGGGAGSKGTATAVSGTAGTGGGGGGGGFLDANNGVGGAGGSGIVIIKLKSTTAIPEGNPITHKTLNFAFNSDNLVAWYKFNGNYLDSSGYGNNLTNVGTIIQSTHIIEGQAVEFDSTDYLEFPATINPYSIWNGKGITFSFWVRFTSITGTYSRFIDFQSGANSASGILFAFKADPNAFYLNCGGTTLSYSNSSIITTLGVWHHILWSIDVNGKWDLYLNNVRINNTETSAVPNITYNLRYINKSVYTGNGVWGGQMDDFRIYERGLSATDVASLYNKTYSTPSNTYTLNFPVPTLADINNNSNIILRGAYDIALSTTNAIITPKTGQYIPKPTTFASDLLSIRYNILNPMNDPTGAQWAYSSNNTNMYHMGSVGIGTTNPEYQLDVSGSVNAKSYYLNGRQINEPLSELGLSEGMIAQVRHLTYTQMDIKNNTGWDAINDNLTTGFVIAITPKSNLSKILLNIIVHIGLAASNYSVWWGIKLYRKIGAGDWTEVTGPNGTETGSAAATAGTPVWISYTMYAGDLDYKYKVTNVTGTYLDSPNTTSTVYYTAYWNNRIGDNPSAINTIYLNRAESHGDAYRPAPSSSWTASEIWYGPSI